ncbi:glycosyltransferase family 2 protein [Lysinimonas soli]|uniref:Glycosyltransferase family 2 protein n=1 Tax=Lysinimonas soli TaxID=1074233 RepID=A0ABW0NTR9_9MICO
MKTLIAIPAFNEQDSLGKVIADVAGHFDLDDVVVVDDGSTDRTFEIAQGAGVHVLRHSVNLGVGAAMGTAFQYAARRGYERLIQFDADGQHRPEFLQLLLDDMGDFDIVIGSRFADGGYFRTTWARRNVMRIIAWVVSRYARSRLTDVTSGFRASGPRAIALFAQHYPVEYLGDTVESIVLAARQGLRVKEVPVQMNERFAGLPSQSFLRAFLYTGRIFLILVLATFRNAPPSIAKKREEAKVE